MSDAAHAIYSRLKNDATLSGLLAGGIHMNTPKTVPDRPWIRYQLVNLVQRLHTMNGDAALVIDRYQVDIFCDTVADLLAVDDQVMALLSRWSGTEAGVTINSSLHVDRQDDYESETELHRRSNDFHIAWYES